MPITSISLLRHHPPPFFPSATLLRRFSTSAAARNNPTKVSRKFQPHQPSKHLLKARETVKQVSTLAPVLSPDDSLLLSNNQAIGIVAASQANFMRVVIQFPPPQPSRSFENNRDEFVDSEASRSSAEVSGVRIEKLEKNIDQFVNPEASGVRIEKLKKNRDEFVDFKVSRSSADVSGVLIEKSEKNRDELVDLEASRSSAEVSGVRIEKLEKNRDEFVDLEASRSSGIQFSQAEGRVEKLEENRDEFVDLQASRSSGVRFSQAEGCVEIEKLERNRDEYVQVEGSRSSGELAGGRFSQSEATIKKLEENEGGVMQVDEGSGRLGEGNGVLEASRSSGEVDGIEFSQSEGVMERLERNGGGVTEVNGGWGNEGKRGVELLCVVKAVLKKIKRRVLVGDKVLVGSIDWIDRRGMIENVFERKSEVVDPPVANVDHMVVLFSMDQPKIEPFSLTRFLVEAESTGIPFSLALNKSELVSEETLLEWKSRLGEWGYRPVFCSIESMRGLDTLEFILREQTSVIVGPSGVGKSSLINALRGNNTILGVLQDDNCLDHILGSKWLEEQRVGEISMRSGRGKHTTRHVSLLPLTGGGYLADTPGFNQPSLIKVTKQSLAHHFPEIRKMLEDSELKKCSFSNCLHVGEPGCVVKGDWERYPYYLQLLDEISIREEIQLRTIGTKREGDVRYKTGEMGVVQAEPRLEMKKHRRQSRKKVNQSFMDDLDEYDDDDDDENLLDENPVIRAVREEQQ